MHKRGHLFLAPVAIPPIFILGNDPFYFTCTIGGENIGTWPNYQPESPPSCPRTCGADTLVRCFWRRFLLVVLLATLLSTKSPGNTNGADRKARAVVLARVIFHFKSIT